MHHLQFYSYTKLHIFPIVFHTKLHIFTIYYFVSSLSHFLYSSALYSLVQMSRLLHHIPSSYGHISQGECGKSGLEFVEKNLAISSMLIFLMFSNLVIFCLPLNRFSLFPYKKSRHTSGTLLCAYQTSGKAYAKSN